MTHRLFHSDNIKQEGKGIIRNAVRGVISNRSKLLMIYSPINGDYKFPGGGIEDSETHELALQREISEECGLSLKSMNSIVGMITEYSRPKEKDFDYFAMQSFYYHCSLKDFNFTSQKLDNYEKDLGFTPEWIDIGNAISVNQEIMRTKNNFPRWTKRDTYFLKYLSKNTHLLFQ